MKADCCIVNSYSCLPSQPLSSQTVRAWSIPAWDLTIPPLMTGSGWEEALLRAIAKDDVEACEAAMALAGCNLKAPMLQCCNAATQSTNL